MPHITIEQAIEEVRAGRHLIVVDDEDRENEGDLIIAAEKATPQAVNFMVTHGRGLVCIPMTTARLRELQLPMMVQENTSRLTTAFTVSVDVLEGTTTGISVHDRTATIRALLDPKTKPEDLGRPGHIFPLPLRRWRGARQSRTHGGDGRSRPDGGTLSRRRALRGLG